MDYGNRGSKQPFGPGQTPRRLPGLSLPGRQDLRPVYTALTYGKNQRLIREVTRPRGHNPMKKTLIAFLLAATPAFAFAAQEAHLALAEGDFAGQRAEIEEDLADGKTYAEINSRDRAEVREALDRISRELEGVDSV